MTKSQINIIDNEDLLVSVVQRDSDVVTFCFTGIGHAIGGVDIQSFEFAKSSQNSTTIFVVDRKRSWGNNIDFNQLADITKKFTNGKRVNSIGNSMGAFLSILVTKFIPVTSCIAFVPQYSVNKKIIPNENRYDKYTSNITDWKYESLSGCFNKETSYYIFFGADNGIEDEHRSFIPAQKNIFLFLFPHKNWSHSIAQRLKKNQRLYPVIESCVDAHLKLTR